MFDMPGSEEPVFRFLTCPCLAFARVKGKAWREKIPERSEDDFFPANQARKGRLAHDRAKGYFCKEEAGISFCGITCRMEIARWK